MRVLATETIVYSLFSIAARVVLICLSLKNFWSTKDSKETNPLYQLRELMYCLVNWSTLTEIPLFVLSLVYTFPVFHLDDCLCPFIWQLSIGTVVILLTWLKLIVLSTQFQFVGVYVLMLSRVLVTFLKTSVLLCLLTASFGLVFYLSLNDPYIMVVTQNHTDLDVPWLLQLLFTFRVLISPLDLLFWKWSRGQLGKNSTYLFQLVMLHREYTLTRQTLWSSGYCSLWSCQSYSPTFWYVDSVDGYIIYCKTWLLS